MLSFKPTFSLSSFSYIKSLFSSFLSAIRLAENGLPDSTDGKESACNARDLGLIPGSGRSPGEGNGYPLQYSCLENPMDRGAWQAQSMGFVKSRTWGRKELEDLIEVSY